MWTIWAVWDWIVDLEITVVVLANHAMRNAYIQLEQLKLVKKCLRFTLPLNTLHWGTNPECWRESLHPHPPIRTPPSSFGPCTLLLQDGRLSAERPCPWHRLTCPCWLIYPHADLTLTGCQVIGQLKNIGL